MKTISTAAVLLITASAVAAESTRQLDAHEHGVGELNIAFDGTRIAMELHAPGADIVGFEYAATSAEDRAKVDDAVATLARPLDLFTLPAAAGCSVVQASASLESEAEHGHDEHDHDDHGHDDHDAHKEEGHDHAEHDHKEEGHDHAEHADDDHKHEDHAAHKEDDHEDHADAADAAGHTEFHAEYLLNCADPAAATLITFAYFDTFPNAREMEVQVISDNGATAFEVTRDAPTLDLRDMF